MLVMSVEDTMGDSYSHEMQRKKHWKQREKGIGYEHLHVYEPSD